MNSSPEGHRGVRPPLLPERSGKPLPRASLRWLARLVSIAGRYPLSASLVLLLPPALATVSWTTPYFETNDDPWMMLTLSGRVAATGPTEYVVFLNIFLSRAIASLYRLAADGSWYAWLLFASVLTALASILYALLLRGFSIRRVGLFMACFLVSGAPFLVELQFTRVAFLLALSGVFLLYVTLQLRHLGAATTGQTYRRLAGAALLLALGFMIRQKSLYLVLGIAAPVIFYLAAQLGKSKAAKDLLLAAAGIGLLLAGLGYGNSRAYNQDPDWARYREINHLKSWFVDYERIRYDDRTKEIFDRVGWTYNDYQMMRNWFYLDTETYSLDKLREIVSHFPMSVREALLRISAATGALIPRLAQDRTVWISISMILGILILSSRSREHIMVLISTAAAAIFGMILLLAFLKLPSRVFEPAVMSWVWLALLIATGRRPTPTRRPVFLRAGGLLCVATALLLAVAPGGPIQRSAKASQLTLRSNLYLREALSRIRPQQSQTFISWGGSFPYEFILPLENKDYLRDLRILGIGFTNRSPLQQRMMDDQGISDLPRAVFERDDVLFFERRGTLDFKDLLVRYFAEHYEESIRPVQVFHHGAIKLWRFVRPPPVP